MKPVHLIGIASLALAQGCSSSGDEATADQGGMAGQSAGGNTGVSGKGGGSGVAGTGGKTGSSGKGGGAAGSGGMGGSGGASGGNGGSASAGKSGSSGLGGSSGKSGSGGANGGGAGKSGSAGLGAAGSSAGKSGGTSGGNGGSGTAGTNAGGTGPNGGSGGSAVATKSCKRGIAYGHNSVEDLTALSKGMSWWYNWSPGPDAAVASVYASLGVEFVPMIWGPGDLDPKRVALIPKDAKVLLTFNEPNFKSQSNLSPQQAATLWPQVETIANDRGLKLASPALNYCGPASNCWTTDPFDWFDQFFAACPGCKVDYLAVHWYACTKGALTSYLDKMKSKYGKPIWLTEFSCLDDPSQKGDPAKQTAYMNDALTLMEGDPMIARYSWFTGRWMDEPAIDLLGGNGQLTPLGATYTQAPFACTP